MSVKVVASKYTISEGHRVCLGSLSDFFVYPIAFQRPTGKQSINHYGALCMGKALEGRTPSWPDLGKQCTLSWCGPDVILNAADYNSEPQVPTWPASQTHECEDTLCLCGQYPRFKWTCSYERMRGRGGLWLLTVLSHSLYFLTQPPCPSTSVSLLPRLPPKSWFTLCEGATFWLHRMVSLFIVVCSQGSVARERENEPSLSMPAGCELARRPANVSFRPLLNKAVLVCTYIL